MFLLVHVCSSYLVSNRFSLCTINVVFTLYVYQACIIYYTHPTIFHGKVHTVKQQHYSCKYLCPFRTNDKTAFSYIIFLMHAFLFLTIHKCQDRKYGWFGISFERAFSSIPKMKATSILNIFFTFSSVKLIFLVFSAFPNETVNQIV